jgi:hypothetical protein
MHEPHDPVAAANRRRSEHRAAAAAALEAAEAAAVEEEARLAMGGRVTLTQPCIFCMENCY